MSGIKDTSLLAFEARRKTLAPDQDAVLSILEEIGPAADKRILEALNQKEQAAFKPKIKRRKWTINLVTPRRGELVEMKLVRDLGKFRHPSRKAAVHIWRVAGDDREPVGWTPVPGDEPKPKTNSIQTKQHIEHIKRTPCCIRSCYHRKRSSIC